MRARRALGGILAAIAIASGALGSACALAFPIQLDVDASSDAAGSETRGPGADVEAGAYADSADAGPWCAQQLQADASGFCDDFDTETLVTNLWNYTDPDDTSVAFSTQYAVSRPYSADFELLPGDGASTCIQSHLDRIASQGSPPPARVHAEVEIYAETASLPVYSLNLAGGACGLYLSLDPLNAFIWEEENMGGTNAFHYLDYGMPEGNEYSVAFDFDGSDASSPTLTVTINGTAITPPITVEAACAGAGAVTTSIGYFCVGSTGTPVHVYYDNVLTYVH